jgi:integrase/recombinase XerD
VKTAPLLKAKTTSTNTITNTSTKNKNKNHYNLAAVSSNFDNDKIRRKIENAVDGLPFQCFNFLHNRVLPANKENVLMICDYISSLKSEINPSDRYRKNTIILLCTFSTFFKNTKQFKETTREDLLSFLDSYRKIETVDPLHKWIGTYNLYRIQVMRFFKWLYSPDIEQKKRPKPSIIENIPQLKRKEKSIYKPTDLWTPEDDSLFLRYCPNPRDRCYHEMSRDSAGRPNELLKLKIKDLVFKMSPDKKQYAEILINGKTGTRHIPLIDSIPYIKDWISQHPQGGNPNSVLLCGLGKSLNRVIHVRSLARIYEDYRDKFFPRLLDNPNVPPEDKQKIKDLLKKPWNPYIRRHSSLTEKSTILKEHVLRQFAGWSPGSNMHLKYLHYFGNESNDSILEAYGIISKDKNQLSVLRPKSCPNCNEPNKPDSKFCAKCRMVLTYDAYNETVAEKVVKDEEVENLKVQMAAMQEAQREVVELLKNPAKLLTVLKNDSSAAN